MKKKFIIAFIAFIFIVLQQPSSAVDGSFSGNEPGVLNKQYMQQLKDFEIEKKVIETTESDIERKSL